MIDSDRTTRTCEAAISYADLGLFVLPLWSVDANGKCLCGDSDCVSPGKHPHGRHAHHGLKDATQDGNVICGWFSNGQPVNIGIRTGAESGIVVLDIDYRDGGDEAIRGFPIPDRTPCVKTGGGLHYYFKHPGAHVKSLAKAFGPGLDCKGDGGYVVAPPSLHHTGTEYTWRVDPRAGLPDAPAWMLNGHAKAKPAQKKTSYDRGSIPEGQRDTRLTSIAGSLRRQGCGPDEIYEALCKINSKRCTPPLDDEQVRKIASSVANYPAAEPEMPSFEAVTVNLAYVKPERLRWLWHKRVPRGGVTLFVGNPGEGKSTCTMRIAANVTTGEAWPDRPGETRAPAGVVLLSAEDRLADVVVPRLLAAGADLKRIEAINAIKERDEDGQQTIETLFDISLHTEALQAVIDRQGDTALLIIDPVTAFLGKCDSHKNAETRRVLARLSKLAERNDLAIICVSHFNKNVGQSSSNRIIGSIAFNAMARAVWHVARDPNDSERRLFLPGKNNNAPEGHGLAFRLVGTQDGDITSVKALFEAEAVYTTIDDVLTPSHNTDGAITKIDDAASWLRDRLSGGERLSATLIEEGRGEDYSRDVMYKAKNRLGVRARKIGFGKESQWFWALPSDNGEM